MGRLQGGLLTAQATTALGCEALCLWLEFGERGKHDNITRSRRHRLTQRQLAAATDEIPRNTTSWWEICSTSFAHRNHPILTTIFGSDETSFPILDEEEYSPAGGECAELRALRRKVLQNRLF